MKIDKPITIAEDLISLTEVCKTRGVVKVYTVNDRLSAATRYQAPQSNKRRTFNKCILISAAVE